MNSVYIKEEFGTRVEFPNSNGKFNLAPFSDGTSFEVYGDGTFSDDVQVANQTAGTSTRGGGLAITVDGGDRRQNQF